MSSGFLNVEYYDNPPLGKIKTNDKFFRLCYCQRGRLLNTIDNVSAVSVHGDASIVPPDASYEITVKAPCSVFFIILFDEEFINTDFLSALRGTDRLLPKIVLSPEEIVFFEGATYKILNEFNSKRMNFLKIINGCLSTLINVLHRSHHEQLSLSSPASSSGFYAKEEMIRFCVSYVDAHCCDSITLTDITRLSAMSRSLFCNLFKKETGLSFNDYINRKRIQKAIALIKMGRKITDISQMCGYVEFSTFYRNFCKFTGNTPQNYKNLHTHRNQILQPLPTDNK